MAKDIEPFDESGVRRRKSSEHDADDDGDGVASSVDDDVQVGNRILSTDGSVPITHLTATDAAQIRPSPIEDFERVRDTENGVERKPNRKRKSDEISRNIKTGSKSDEQAVSRNVHYYVESQPAKTSRSDRAPEHVSPTSSKPRTRGMSMRNSIFTKNLSRRSQHDESGMEMQPIKYYSDNTSKEPSVTVTPVLDRFASHVSDRVPSTGPIRLTSPELTRVTSRKDFQGVSALPNYQQLVQDRAHRHLPIQRAREAYRRARKFLLRIQEIPPSKDGRHIPLDVFRKKALVDDRTGHPYVSNFIKSSKYTAWNFLPRQLFAQFSKLANFYFLTISILQMIPGLSTTGTYTTIIPLMFFVSISMAKEGYEDLRRHRLDKAENNREAHVLHAYGPVGSSGRDTERGEDGPIHWAPVKWQSLRVGDVVKLERDETAPADILLLNSKGDNNIAYIETMALDGETNLKTKQPSGALVALCGSAETIAAAENIEIVVEDPNLNLYNFDGRISVDGSLAPLTNNAVIYRGSILRNTSQAIGLVVYSGEECKIRMNANKNPRIKAPTLQSVVNKIVIFMVFFVVFLALFNTIAYQVWHHQVEIKCWYLTDARVAFGPILVSFVIMFNTMIPLSLYVSLEIIKVFQMFLLNDVDMYDEASNTPFEARTSTINEELGQVSYVFSDKTGTLTDNVMRFRKLSVAGTVWLHATDLEEHLQADLLLQEQTRPKDKRPLRTALRKSKQNTSVPTSGLDSHLDLEQQPRNSTTTWRSGNGRVVGQPESSTVELIRCIQRRPHTAFARRASMMILSMALCHTCLPEHRSEDQITYQAASPDELALVQAARDLGYQVFSREISTLTIKTYPNGQHMEPVLEKYEILDVLEFSSNRKRMSVVVRLPDGRICIICKGADSVIAERLRLSTLAKQKINEIGKRVDARRSIEAHEALQRRSSTLDRHGSVGSFPRTSMALPRTSVGRQSIGKLAPIRDDVHGWLKDREQDIVSPREADHYSPRQSAQMSRRSGAYSERNSFQSDVNDIDLVEESLVLDDSAVIERCFQHINDFATEGLRTLLYGHRFLTEDEYSSWKKVYQHAITSLEDREAMIESAGELIEQQLELTGATAIEDKLQSGVPETIDRLRRANIKLWMLTGDKRETAINIGHSCRLIKDYSSVTILDHEAGGVEQNIAAAIVDINRGSVAHSVIIIDGRTLGMIQGDDSLHALSLDLAILADSVICCRASPSQKAHLVHSIRRRVDRSVTLAIGDGANDIAMIQEAHVGIGITGKEGFQAARASDYSIAQFRFLNKLLLVHGRWNYVRTCKYTLATFWKEMLFYLTQAVYQRWNGYTGTSLYEQWSLSMFNTLFTSLPVIFLGFMEQDLSPATLIAVPELYSKGQRSGGFNFKIYLSWMFMAASEAMIVFFTMRGLYALSLFTFGKDLFSMGDLTFSACIIVINIKCQLLEQRNRTVMALACVIIEIGGWFLWNIILSTTYSDNNEYDVKEGFLERFGTDPLWWLCLLLIVAACVVYEMSVRALKSVFFPTDVETFQQLERDAGVRRRFEEASASELQAGWDYAMEKNSRFDLHREADELPEREGEVQDLLDRPRVMEEGRCESKKGFVIQSEERVVTVGDGKSTT